MSLLSLLSRMFKLADCFQGGMRSFCYAARVMVVFFRYAAPIGGSEGHYRRGGYFSNIVTFGGRYV